MTVVIKRRIYPYITLTTYLLHFLASSSVSLATEEGSKYKLVQTARLLGLNLIEPLPAQFNTTYHGDVTDNRNVIYSYTATDTKTRAVRIFTTANESEKDYPTIVVIRQARSVMSWQIPLLMQDSSLLYEYESVSRTLCPVDTNHTEQKINVEISTQSKKNVSYTLKAILQDNFMIETDKHEVTSSPSNPVFAKYTFPEGVQSVLVRATSADTICAVLSIQNTKCPVFDLDTDVKYQGKYQTMTTQGAITIEKSDYKSGSFFVVLVVKPNDYDCTDGINQMPPAGVSTTRQKNVTINISKTISSSQYYRATLIAAAFFAAFYVVALLIGIFYHGCKENWGIIDLTTFETSMNQEELKEPVADSSAIRGSRTQDDTRQPIIENRGGMGGGAQGYGSISNPASNPASRSATDQSNARAEDQESINSEDFDMVKDADQDKNIFRTKTALFVVDLARKNEKRADKTYKLYYKNLFIIAVFYGLPVIQLVMTYQTVLNFTGDQDICYYNFACAHPLGRVSSFNNIYSNIGYILLGILFLILVARRELLHRKAVERSEGRHKKFGIPQHFGLFYAMGFALCMEGIMSACYHVCPTVSNFQFDTSFMYIIACLCILKIYQNRHPDISAKAHFSYTVMAIVIIIAVIGVVYGTNIFWILFAIVYLGASLVLSVHLYYMGRWQIDRYICNRLWLMIISDWLKCSRPVYGSRLILLILGNAVNWGIGLYAGITAPSDFASLLLTVFIVNLALYMGFYVFMKMWAREKIPKLTILFILLAAVTWGFALYFFVAHLTTWQLSPAGSREGNKECILFQFYDKHDVWHFLSAISLFFSFLILLTLDDEIILTRRDKIPVF
ncbi:SID1 transmembrane family member 1-like isoform X2 [Mercenaria mercenaria]|uniref:SID1 transmembrane family member 1-like isoform X2 n=1 Tax=Mercenaria mercenaria TaxID=6596 RepID=UPI00234F450C|nr:SID1 transmembrane family member 1-like isoform X2 [Mercenaria mercenaria]